MNLNTVNEALFKKDFTDKTIRIIKWDNDEMMSLQCTLVITILKIPWDDIVISKLLFYQETT